MSGSTTPSSGAVTPRATDISRRAAKSEMTDDDGGSDCDSPEEKEPVYEISTAFEEKFYRYVDKLKKTRGIDSDVLAVLTDAVDSKLTDFITASEVTENDNGSNLSLTGYIRPNAPSSSKIKQFIVIMNAEFEDEEGDTKFLRQVQADVTVSGTEDGLEAEVTVKGVGETRAEYDERVSREMRERDEAHSALSAQLTRALAQLGLDGTFAPDDLASALANRLPEVTEEEEGEGTVAGGSGSQG